MTRQRFVSLVLKCMGLGVLLIRLDIIALALQGFLLMRQGEVTLHERLMSAAFTLVMPTAFLLGCILIIVLSDKIAARLVPGDDALAKVSLDGKLAIMLICFGIGLYSIVLSVPTLVSIATSYILGHKTPHLPMTDYQKINLITKSISGGLQLLLGILLVLNAQGISALWNKCCWHPPQDSGR